jgi:amidase
MDGLEQAQAVARGEVSGAELLEACLSRIEMLDPLLGAITDLKRSGWASSASGSFRGVPFLVKDVLPWPELRWSMGSRLFAHQTGRRESPLGKRLTAAGLVCVGKSAMSEFGLLASTESVLEGVTHNPWELSCSPAGSSGGSAVAVAAGLVPLAFGSDGGGSIRMPASACGVFGFKPSRGRTVSNGLAASDLLDLTSDGCISRSVRDSAMFLSVIEDPASGQPPLGFVDTPITKRLRVATWTRTLSGSEPQAAVLAAHARAVEYVRELGHVVEAIAAPDFGPELGTALLLISGAAAAEIVHAQDRVRRDPVQESELDPFTWALIEDYTRAGSQALEGARATLRAAAQAYRAATLAYDIVLTPTLASEPWPVGYLSGLLPRETLLARVRECMAYTPIQNIAGAPAMSVPLCSSERGLPIGMQFAAARGNDALLLGLAYQLEAAYPWKNRWPPYSIPALAANAR